MSNTGPHSDPSGVRPHILFVEDDPAYAGACVKLLEGAGFCVVHAPDYREALTHLESEAPVDLLLTDIVMPERVNGLALARMARMRRPGLKILYATGYDIPGLDEEALGTVLRKPVEDQQLIAQVRLALAS